MTVQTLAPRDLSAEDKREHVLAYVTRPWGMKTAYLDEHGITSDQMKRWRATVADGDLDGNRIPRQTGTMTRDDVTEIRRLREENARLETARQKAEAEAERMGKAADAPGWHPTISRWRKPAPQSCSRHRAKR